jgi:hypothetical protein
MALVRRLVHQYYFIGIGLGCGGGQPIEDESSNFIAVRKMIPSPTSVGGNGSSSTSDGSSSTRTSTISGANTTATAPSNLLYVEFQNGTGGQVDFQSPNYYEMFDMDAVSGAFP